MNMNKKNELALQYIRNYDFYNAQVLLMQNISDFPCWLTYHNLGVFYLMNGKFLNNINNFNASNIAYKYLSSALKFEISELTLSALGYYYFWERQYSKSKDMYKKSLDINNGDISSIYNYALCLYYLNEYDDSMKVCIHGMNLGKDDKELFAKLLIYNMLYINASTYRILIKELLDIYFDDIAILNFYCFYKMGDYINAKKYISDAINELYISIDEVTIILDYLIETNQLTRAEDVYKIAVNNIYDLDYDERDEDLAILKKLYDNKEKRREYLDSLKRNFMPKKQWLYF